MMIDSSYIARTQTQVRKVMTRINVERINKRLSGDKNE